MITANNGILIVALAMALGLHWNDKWLIAAAFTMAGISYLVNLIDDAFDDTIHDGALVKARLSLFFVTVGVGVATYLYVATKIFG